MTKYSDLSPERYLSRDEVALALSEMGFPVKAKTLATKAVRGGGPPFQRFGKKPLYQWGAALAWAKGCLTGKAENTSEALNA